MGRLGERSGALTYNIFNWWCNAIVNQEASVVRAFCACKNLDNFSELQFFICPLPTSHYSCCVRPPGNASSTFAVFTYPFLQGQHNLILSFPQMLHFNMMKATLLPPSPLPPPPIAVLKWMENNKKFKHKECKDLWSKSSFNNLKHCPVRGQGVGDKFKLAPVVLVCSTNIWRKEFYWLWLIK